MTWNSRFAVHFTRTLGCVVLLACTSPESILVGVPTVPDDVSAATKVVAGAVRVADSLLVVHAGRDAREIAKAGLPRDQSGLIGRNREWGQMYAARFQMGTGAALRMALTTASSADGARDAQLAMTGIEVGLQGMDAIGRPLTKLPLSVSMGREAAPIDIASGAAFYLGDACLGLLALEAAPERSVLVSTARRRELRAKLVHSIRWLTSQSSLLLDGDRSAPNRLLFDARAYLACGALADDSTIRAVSNLFIDKFRKSVTPAGWFLEANGWDTSYQAVSLDIGMDVAVLLAEGTTRTGLVTDLLRGSAWLVTRVAADGRVESRGNTRTCSGGEAFLDTPKSLALTSVVIGLARVAVIGAAPVDASSLDASRRVSGWARGNSGVNPCFEGIL